MRKFKIKNKVVISTIVLSMVTAQILNSLGSNVIICEAKSLTVNEAKEVCEEEGWSMPKKGGNNEENTLGYGRDGKIYRSVKGYTNYPKMRVALEDKFSEKELYDTSVWTAPGRTWKHLRAYYNDKEQRAELNKIAAETMSTVKSTDKEAALVAIATYYGVINDEDKLNTYSRSKTISRYSLARMTYMTYYAEGVTGGFDSDSVLDYIGKNSKYAGYSKFVEATMDSSLLECKVKNSSGKVSTGTNTATSQEMASAATRMEVLYSAVSFNNGTVKAAMSQDKAYKAKALKNIKKVFKDIKVVKDGKVSDRTMTKGTTLDESTAVMVYAMYEAGIIKPDSKGNANLGKKCTQKEALEMHFGVLEWACSLDQYDYYDEDLGGH
nr:hypothetical protein [uncultured Anaerosporobacter sp.]